MFFIHAVTSCAAHFLVWIFACRPHIGDACILFVRRVDTMHDVERSDIQRWVHAGMGSFDPLPHSFLADCVMALDLDVQESHLA